MLLSFVPIVIMTVIVDIMLLSVMFYPCSGDMLDQISLLLPVCSVGKIAVQCLNL